jgi:uracil-DNA glycosylase family 4
MSGFFTSQEIASSRARIPLLPQCGKCGLYKKCLSPKMAPSGKGKHSIMFLGEAPGQQEDERGTQLIGKTGQRLRAELKKLGLNLDDCIKHNAASCRPPKNKIEDKHIEFCRPLVLKAIREHKPTVIVLLGGMACKSVIQTERTDSVGSIGQWVGWTIPSHTYGAWLCPVWHPSYIERMHNDVLDKLFSKYLRQATALEDVPITTPTLSQLKDKVEVILSPSLAQKRMRDLSRKEGRIAFDWETTGRKPDNPKQRILSASFCHNGEDTWACLVDSDILPSLAAVLENPNLKKIAHNVKFENRWATVKVTKKSRGWHHCTMNTAHILDNRSGVTGLKFQSYVNFGIADYEQGMKQYMKEDPEGLNRLHEAPPREMLMYNGLDSLLTDMLYQKQVKMLGYD